MATFAERLKIALKNKGMKQTVLAYRIGVDRSYISNYLSGKYKPSADTHNKIAEILGVSSTWLSGYDVPMNSSEQTTETLSPDKQLLLELYDKVDENDRELVINMIKAALKKEGI